MNAEKEYEINKSIVERVGAFHLREIPNICGGCKFYQTGLCQGSPKLFEIDRKGRRMNEIWDSMLKNKKNEPVICKGCGQSQGGDWCQCPAKLFEENFKNWTSGNPIIDKFIQESQLNAKETRQKLEWIEYSNFENVQLAGMGGFGEVYKATWKDGPIVAYGGNPTRLRRDPENLTVALKRLYNSKGVTPEFLKEIKLHLKMNESANMVMFFGITKDPKTNNFMTVMLFAQFGNLRKKLKDHFIHLSWYDKIEILCSITQGLSDIHKEGLIHRDFHSGNILNTVDNSCCITDLGLCRPENETDNEKRYGVLPFVAPEVLKREKYTQKSDIYSCGIVMYEVISGLFPYHDIISHDGLLATKILSGLRPTFSIKVPQLIDDIFKQCVDVDPSKRPTAEYLNKQFDEWFIHKKFRRWYFDQKYPLMLPLRAYYDEEKIEICKQIKETEKINNSSSTSSLTNNETYMNKLLNRSEQKNSNDYYKNNYGISNDSVRKRLNNDGPEMSLSSDEDE